MSMMPPAWATTDCTDVVVTVGFVWRQVAPWSELTARPQLVPTSSLLVPGPDAIPYALAWLLHGGAAVAGCCQWTPPSVLRQIPPALTVCVSPAAVRMTLFAFDGSKRTSPMRKGTRPLVASMCVQLAPPSAVRKRPPPSVATSAAPALVGLMVTATARPPKPLGSTVWNCERPNPVALMASSVVPVPSCTATSSVGDDEQAAPEVAVRTAMPSIRTNRFVII